MSRAGTVARVTGKVIGWTLVAVLSLVVLVLATLFIGVRTKPGARLLVRIGLGVANKVLAAQISVGELRTNLWSGLEIDDVNMRDAGGELCAHVDRLNVKFSILPLLGSTVRVKSVNVVGAKGLVRTLPTGEINFAALLKPSEPTPARPDQPDSKFRVEIDDANVDVIGRYVPDPALKLPPIEGHVQAHAKVGIGGGDVKVDLMGVNVDITDKPGPLSLRGHGSFTVHEGELTFGDTQLSVDTEGRTARPFVPTPELRGKYHLDVEAQGPLTDLQLVAQMRTPSKPLYVDGELLIGETFGWKGHVVTKDLDPELIVVGAPHALVWIDAKGESTKSGATIGVAHAQVQAGKNRVHVAGKVYVGSGIRADGDVEIVAPDLSTLKGRGLPKLAGSVAGIAKVHYTPTELSADADLSAKDLVVPGVRVRQLSVKAHTKNLGGHANIVIRDLAAGTLQIGDARVQLDGDKKSFLLRVTGTGDNGTSVDLALAGIPRYESSPIPAGIAATLNVLDVDRNNERWRIDPGAHIKYDHGVAIQGFRARSERQSIAIDGTLDESFSTIDASVRAVGLDLNRIVALVAPADTVPHSHLDLSITAKGALARPTVDLALAGTITRTLDKPEQQVHASVQGHLDPKNVTAKADFATDAGTISLDAALPFITSPKVLLASPLPVHLQLDATVKSVHELYDTIGWKQPPPALSALEAKMKISVKLEGTGRAPVLNLEIDGDGMRYGPMHDAELRAKVAFAHDKLDTEVTLSLGTSDAALPTKAPKPAGALALKASLPVVLARMVGPGSLRDKVGANAPLHAELRLQKIAVAQLPLSPLGISVPLDGGHVDAQVLLGGVVGDPTLRIALDGQNLRRGSIRHVDLGFGLESYGRATQASALVSLEKQPLASVKGRINHDLGAYLAKANLDDTILDASVTFLGFDLSKFSDIVPGLAGKLAGKFLAKGNVTDPRVSGTLTVDQLAFGGSHFDSFKVDGSYAKAAVNASLDAHEPSGGKLKGAFALKGGILDASVDAEKLALDFESLSDDIPLRRLRGMIDLHLGAHGPTSAPLIGGMVYATKTTLAIAADPREFTDLNVNLEIAPQAITLRNLTGKLGPGHFDVRGEARMASFVPQSVDLHIKTWQLPAVQNPLSVAVDSQIDIHGEKKGNALVGVVKMNKGAARLPSLTNVRSLQDTGDLKDVTYVDARARRKAARRVASQEKADSGESMDVEIETKIPGPFHVHSEELNVDLKGDLTIKVHGPTFGLSGQVEALNGGRATLFGKRYDIERVRVGFDGSAEIDPELDVKIMRSVNDAMIGVQVTGSASRPEVRFVSQPPIYSDSQVMLALLGSDPGEPTDTTPIGDKIGGAVSGLIVGQLKNQLAPHLPIDVIKVDVGDTPDFSQTRLEIGKYIRNNVYVSYAHQFGQLLIGTRILSSNEGSVEYRFKRNYALDLTIGDAPEGKADLYWTLHF